MPKYYCDYCDVYLTHDSASVRKAHNSGRNHVTNVRDWYASLWTNEAQDRIDEITRKYDANNAQPQVPRQIPGSTNPMLRMPLPPMPQGVSFNQPFHPNGVPLSGGPPMPPPHGSMHPPPFGRPPMAHPGNVN